MLKFILPAALLFLDSLIGLRAIAQPQIPAARIKTLRGAITSFGSAVQKDSLILVCFWSTTSDMSIAELNSINANYEKWKKGVAFRMMAVSIDEGQAANKIRPTVNMNDWQFEVFSDIFGDLRKALGSNNLPQAMIIKKNKLIYEQSGYEPGSESYLFHKMQVLASGRD